MNKAQALAKARKILGPKAEIRVSKNVPVGEARLGEIERRRALTQTLKTMTEARDSRRASVLKADDEYQRLRTQVTAIEKERDSLHGAHSRRVTVVLQKSWYNEIICDGDNFDEALAALIQKRTAAVAA